MATDAFILDQAGVDRIMRVVRQVESLSINDTRSSPDIQRIPDTRLYQVGKSIGPQESTVFTGNRWTDTASTEFPTIGLPAFATIDWFKWGSQKAMPSIAFRPIPHHQWINYQPPAARWGIITAAVTTRLTSTDCDSVTIDPTTGCDGSGRETSKNWRVELPNRTGGAPSLTTGEVLGYMPVNTGQLVAVTPYAAAGSVLWLLTTENWEDNVACDTVKGQACEDCDGLNPTGGTLTVLLPKNAAGEDGMDPNVVSGAVISYTTASDGTLVCTSDYLDDAIGTVKMWALDSGGGIPSGWAVMDGSSNSIVNGGSGVNMSQSGGLFARHGIPGSFGGRTKHSHLIEIGAAIDAFAAFEAALGQAIAVGIQVFDHTVGDLHHVHSLFADTAKLQGTGASFKPQPQTELCTGNPIGGVHDALVDPCPTGAWGPLEHEVQVNLQNGAISAAMAVGIKAAVGNGFTNEADHIPPFGRLLYIERIDNNVNA